MEKNVVNNFGSFDVVFEKGNGSTLTDINGKNFIEVDGERKYLDKKGKVANKQRGSKSVKTAIENFEDMKRVQDYFIENELNKEHKIIVSTNEWKKYKKSAPENVKFVGLIAGIFYYLVHKCVHFKIRFFLTGE